MMVLSIFLILLAAGAKAVMDASEEGSLPWNPMFWAKEFSWKRKWKNGDPEQGEAFPGSSTVFVFLTDGWHLAQFFFLNSLFASALPFVNYKFLLVARVGFGIAFEVIYRSIRRIQ
jgi:hypothetical protein